MGQHFFIRSLSENKFKWIDEETVYKIWLIDSTSVGDGAIPHTPPPGRNPPRTPGMNCDVYLPDVRQRVLGQ